MFGSIAIVITVILAFKVSKSDVKWRFYSRFSKSEQVYISTYQVYISTCSFLEKRAVRHLVGA
jgi:hypothetical protein